MNGTGLTRFEKGDLKGSLQEAILMRKAGSISGGYATKLNRPENSFRQRHFFKRLFLLGSKITEL